MSSMMIFQKKKKNQAMFFILDIKVNPLPSSTPVCLFVLLIQLVPFSVPFKRPPPPFPVLFIFAIRLIVLGF